MWTEYSILLLLSSSVKRNIVTWKNYRCKWISRQNEILIWTSYAFLVVHQRAMELMINKKVLLRERKRHTARRVASTPYVVLTGYPPGAGYPPSWPGRGGYLPGYPPARVPPGRVPPSQGTPPGREPPRQGTPPPAGPGRVPPDLPHGILGNFAKHYGIWVPHPRVWTN